MLDIAYKSRSACTQLLFIGIETKTKVEETLLGCNDMQPGIDLLTFRMNVLPPDSESRGNHLLVSCLLELLYDSLEDGCNRYFRNVCHTA